MPSRRSNEEISKPPSTRRKETRNKRNSATTKGARRQIKITPLRFFAFSLRVFDVRLFPLALHAQALASRRSYDILDFIWPHCSDGECKMRNISENHICGKLFCFAQLSERMRNALRVNARRLEYGIDEETHHRPNYPQNNMIHDTVLLSLSVSHNSICMLDWRNHAQTRNERKIRFYPLGTRCFSFSLQIDFY